MTSVLRIIPTAIHIMKTYTSDLGWGGGSAGDSPAAGAGVVGVGEDVAGAATLTAVAGTALGTTAMGIMAMATAITAMGITATAMVPVAMGIMAMATVIAGMAIRMDRPAGILPEHPIQVDTQAGKPGQAEDLRVASLAEPDSRADMVGLWPQPDIRAHQPPLGGVNLVRRQRDTPRRGQRLEQAVRAPQEQLRLGDAKRPGLSQPGPHPRGLQPGLASR